MSLLGPPTPLNRKHLVHFLSFSKTLRARPHISNFFPNHWVGLAALRFVTNYSIHGCSVLPCIINLYPFVYPINTALTTSRESGGIEAESKFAGKSIIKAKTQSVHGGGFAAV